MKEIEKLFFELIRIALGNQTCLSQPPKESEWGELYTIAKRQGLLGVSFAGVKRLQQQQEPPKMLYLTWMNVVLLLIRNIVISRSIRDKNTIPK